MSRVEVITADCVYNLAQTTLSVFVCSRSVSVMALSFVPICKAPDSCEAKPGPFTLFRKEVYLKKYAHFEKFATRSLPITVNKEKEKK